MAVDNGNRPTPTTGAGGLRPDRLRLLAKVARMYHERGLRQDQIAGELHLSMPTVSTYRARILEKLNMKTTAELMRYALRTRLVD